MKKLECAILAIGSELLEGSIVDTNSSFLAKRLKKVGITPADIRLTPDDEEHLMKSLEDLSLKYPLVLTTGGLGPTFDDITALCVAKSAGVGLEHNVEAYNHLVNYLQNLNVEVKDSHKKQSLLPKGAITFYNRFGTAFGFEVQINKSTVISMPGVPHEMIEMFDAHILPSIKNKFLLQDIHNKDIIFANIPESDVDEAIILLNLDKDVECIINAGKGEVVVKLRSVFADKVHDVACKLKSQFKDNFVAFDASIAETLLSELSTRGLQLSVAESCTGGLVSKLLTDISGSSTSFNGGVVSYANDVKVHVLGIDDRIINESGAVSEDVALLMANGVQNRLHSDVAIAITGIAGPNGATATKKVGMVYIAIKYFDKSIVKHYEFSGNRQVVREKAAAMALFMALQMVRING